MRCRKYLGFNILFLIAMWVQPAGAQEIKGDTLYASVAVPVILRFPAVITSCVYSDKETVGFTSVVVNTTVTIRAKTDLVKPAVVLVTEGGRNHSFVLAIRKGFSPVSLLHQWLTTEDLKNYVSSLEAKKQISAGINQNPATKGGSTLKNSDTAYTLAKKRTANDTDEMIVQYDPDTKKWIQISKRMRDSLAELSRIDAAYDSLLSKGNESIAALDYSRAKEYFQQAHDLKPLKLVPLSMLKHVESAAQNLAQITRRKDSVERVAETRKLMENANKEIVARNWSHAKELYEKILTLQPTPAQEEFAKKKIEAIDLEFKRIAQPAVEKETPAVRERVVPPIVVKETVTASDSITKTIVNNVSEAPKMEAPLRTGQESFTQRKIQINEWMDKGQQAFLSRDWNNAKAYYKKAIDLFPSIEKEKFARKKIQEIELEKEREKGTPETVIDSLKIVKEEEDAMREQRIDSIFSKAQQEIMAKNWDRAKTFYKEVLTLAPTPSQEEFAKRKIETIDFEVAKTSHQATEIKAPVNPASKPLVLASASKEQKPANVPPGGSSAASVKSQKIEAPAHTQPVDSSQSKTPILPGNASPVSVANTSKNTAINKPANTATVISEEDKRKEQDRILQRKIQSSDWMDKGQQAYSARNWDSAKAFYMRAIALQPSFERQQFARRKLQDIDVEMSKEKMDSAALPANEATNILPVANNAVSPGKTNPEVAKPAVATPGEVSSASADSIHALRVKDSLNTAEQQRKTDSIRIVKEAREAERKALLVRMMDSAQAATIQKNWENAKAYYSKSLEMQPSKVQSDFVQKKMDAIDFELSKKAQAAAAIKEDTLAGGRNKISGTGVQPGAPSQKIDPDESAKIEENRVEQEKLLKRKMEISEWMDKAQQAFSSKNWDTAKSYYLKVIESSPSPDREKYATNRILDIEVEQQIERMDKAFRLQESLQPANTPDLNNNKQEKEITVTGTTKSTTAKPAAKPANSEDDIRKSRVLDLLIEAQKAMIGKNWDSARTLYKQVLSLHPTTEQERFSKQEIAALNQEIAKNPKRTLPAKEPADAGSNNTASSKNAKENDTGSVATEKPASAKPAPKSANPAGNSSSLQSPPPEHTTDSNRIVNRSADDEISSRMLGRAPRFNIVDSSYFVRLILQDIVLSGKNVYLKMLVQNNSSIPFTAGDFNITYIKNYGILKKLFPFVVNDVHDILSKKEATIIYAAEAYPDVQNNEVFIMEMEDKMKTFKMTLHVPGDIYNQSQP